MERFLDIILAPARFFRWIQEGWDKILMVLFPFFLVFAVLVLAFNLVKGAFSRRSKS